MDSLNAPATADQSHTSQSPIPVDASKTSTFGKSLPKIDIPKFSGKYSDWENFRDIFVSIIGDRAEATPILKFYYLRTLLTDEALDKIKNLPINNENYAKA